MNDSVRILRIKVQNVGVIVGGPLELGPFAPGLNLITGPNECGKSTIVRALHAALFQRYSYKGDKVSGLRPHGSKHGPVIEVDLEVGGALYRIEKRLLEKPYARLHCLTDNRVLDREEADAKILELLEAQAGGKQGATDKDMGVWGLLWVRQDGSATVDPGEGAAEGVRGSLAAAIEQQVGAVMGGAHGLRLHKAITEEHLLYFTPDQSRPTKEYAAQLAKVNDLEAKVAEHKKKIADSEARAAECTELERSLGELKDEEKHVCVLLSEAERAARAVACVESEAERAGLDLRDALEALGRVEALHHEREALGAELRARDEKARLHASTLNALSREVEGMLVDADEAYQQLRTSQEQSLGAVRRADEVLGRLQRAEQRERLAKVELDLTDAQALDSELRQLDRELVGLPDGATIEKLERLDAERTVRTDELMRTATSVRVERASGEASAEYVVGHRRVFIEGAGSIEIDPPRGGFLEARRASHEASERVRMKLAALRVSTVAEARAARDERLRCDAEVARLKAELERLAPKKLSALEAEFNRVSRELHEFEQKCVEAALTRDDISRHEQLYAAAVCDVATARQLQSWFNDIERIKGEEALGGVKIRLRPIMAVRVQIGGHDTPRLMSPGQDIARVLTGATTLVIDDRIEVEIDPGVLSVAAKTVEREQKEAWLASKLAALGIATVEEAFAQSSARENAQGALDRARASLAAHAPDGIAALRARVDHRRTRHAELERSLAAARTRSLELAEATAKLAALWVTEADFAELDEIDKRALELEQELGRAAGRVVVTDGVLLELWSGERRPLIAEMAATCGDVRVTITPGETKLDSELPLVEALLSRSLRELGVDGIASARRLNARHLELRTQRDERARHLERVAPRGLKALDLEVQSLRKQPVAPGDDPSLCSLSLRSAHDAMRRSAEEAEALRRVAELAERTLHARAEEGAGRRKLMEEQHMQRVVDRRATEAILQARRAAQPDEALEDLLAAARGGAKSASEREKKALEALREAAPGLRRAEVEQEKRALEDLRKRIERARDESLQKSAVLGQIRSEGGYETMVERELELNEANSELTKIKQRAEAILLLKTVADGEYHEAQRALMKPVTDEAAPLLAKIRPRTTLQMKHHELTLEQIERDGFSEKFEDLSGGTREQLSVIVRIALARVFARHRRALPLILDDILGWTDDQRLRKMISVLEDAARQMQVIVLTCHPGRFSRFEEARVFAIDELKSRAPSDVVGAGE